MASYRPVVYPFSLLTRPMKYPYSLLALAAVLAAIFFPLFLYVDGDAWSHFFILIPDNCNIFGN